MKRNPVGWFEIYVSDMARARAFYEGVFQTKLEKISMDAPDPDNSEMWMFSAGMDLPGATGAICKMDGAEPGRGGTLVYFSCEDCSVEEKRVMQFKGKVHRSKESIGQYGFISLVYDSEGNMIGLHSMA